MTKKNKIIQNLLSLVTRLTSIRRETAAMTWWRGRGGGVLRRSGGDAGALAAAVRVGGGGAGDADAVAAQPQVAESVVDVDDEKYA